MVHVPRPGPVAAIKHFLEVVPELRAEWEEHLRDYEEPLPHVFFGDDVTRFAVRVTQSEDPAMTNRLAEALESMAASEDPDVENVVAVSFVEHFVLGDAADLELLETLKPQLGPWMLGLVTSLERNRDRPPGSRTADRRRSRRNLTSDG
jgi:hypothetical protein